PGCARRGCQPSLAVALEDVLDDRARLEHLHVAVLDRGELAERRPLRERRRGRDEVDRLERVRDAELLEEPVDADGARAGCVIELDHPRNPPTTDTKTSGCSYGTM